MSLFRAGQNPPGSLTFDQYVDLMRERIDRADLGSLDGVELERAQYTKLNLQRTKRIRKTYAVSDSLTDQLGGLQEPQLWLVLTETWCGDSAQNLPYIARIAAAGPHIELRILLRDDNLEVMDRYLTEGKRGIPKLVVFDRDGREVCRWGPRPREAEAIFHRERDAGREKSQIMETMHAWYAKNRGQAIEAEFLDLVKAMTEHG